MGLYGIGSYGTGSTPQTEVSPQWQNYLDLANDVKPWLQFPSTDTTRDVQLQIVLDMACWWAQDYLKQPIAPTTFFRRFNGYSGWTGAHIDLPYFPVIGEPTVVEYWGASGAHTLSLQTPENQGGSNMFTLDSLRGVITRSYLGLLPRPFFPGLKNVEVTWVAGYNPVPPTYRLGTLELVKYWWANTQQSSRSNFQPHGEYDEPAGQHDLWPAVPNRIASMFETGLQVGIA